MRPAPFAVLVLLATAASAGVARAQEAPVAPPIPEPPSPPASSPYGATPRPPPYSLPFQLRPVTAATVVRSDTSFAKYENAASVGGFTVVSTLAASYRIPGTASGGPGTGLAPVVKVALANDSPPLGPGGLAFVNPLVGATYAVTLGEGFRASGFLGVTIPIGMGGGDAPPKGLVDTRSAGINARAAMDNALFAVNDLTIIPGIDLAYVGHRLTTQLEATLFQLTRVRGSAAQLETSKTNFTAGAHVGYFFLDALSVGAELRYQRWLNAPIAVDKDPTHTLVDNFTFGVGPRAHFRIAGVWFRPGIAYSRALDKPLAGTPNYHIVQLDIPIVF